MPLNSILFSQLQIRSLTLKNRVVISPMCQNAADNEGRMTDWHLAHLGQFAMGGAGLVFVESTAIAEDARINDFDVGLWGDHQIAPLKRVTDFVHAQGAAIGVQISHAGRKAGADALCDGGRAIGVDLLTDRDRPFIRVGPSQVAAGTEWTIPREMTLDDIAAVRQGFRQAIRRADQAGVDVIELHYAHGYLVATFLSPHANMRTDAYGGDRKGRMRLAIELAADARNVWPEHKPLFVRLSVFDGSENGWNLDDSLVLAAELKAVGVDVVDCSSGGLTDATTTASIPRGLGFQVAFSARIRKETGVMTQAVGMIVDAHQAEEVLAAGNADLIAIGREALFDPFWARHAAHVLGADPEFHGWNPHNGAYLAKRAPGLERELAARAAENARRTG